VRSRELLHLLKRLLMQLQRKTKRFGN
jgi:hypothetical protein